MPSKFVAEKASRLSTTAYTHAPSLFSNCIHPPKRATVLKTISRSQMPSLLLRGARHLPPPPSTLIQSQPALASRTTISAIFSHRLCSTCSLRWLSSPCSLTGGKDILPNSARYYSLLKTRRPQFPASASQTCRSSSTFTTFARSSILSTSTQRDTNNIIMSASSSLTRRANSTSNKPANSDSTSANSHSHTHSHSSGTNGHSHDEHDDHSHSHSVFGLHAHSHEGGSANADQIVNALQSTGDRGSRVTLIGLFSNVVLTGAKGAAGVYMHSASLMADAAHSMSDLLGDFVTLFCWRLSRKPPTERYPYGFAKFETLGTTTVSLLLVGGALGIGFHSFHLLGHALAETASTMPAGPMQTVLQNVTALTSHIPAVGHSHGHAHALDPNAAWFAAVSVVAKEWLYRITKKVADDEHSPVLLANAVHHRSDAYSSLVALVAILGSWFFPHIPLDPIGGLLVSFVIFQQGLSILRGAYNDLTEASVSPTTRQSLIKALDPLITGVSASSSSSPAELSIGKPSVLSISHLRARWVGSLIFVDLTADVESVLTVKDTAELEERIVEMLRGGRREVMDVRVRFRPVV